MNTSVDTAVTIAACDDAEDSRKSLPLVLIVEDDRGIQELIRFTLSVAGFRAVCADSAEAAQILIETELPDCVIVDWMLPGAAGIHLAKHLRSGVRTRCLPIVMVTARGSEADRINGLEAGADDFVVKPFSPKELVARIQAVMRRRVPGFTQQILTHGPIELDCSTKRVRVTGKAVELDPHQFALLKFLIGHPEWVYSPRQLAAQVWGESASFDGAAVDAHIQGLCATLGSNAGQYIVAIGDAGYKLAADSAAETANDSN